MSQELKRRLHAIDPNLNIVPGGLRHRRGKMNGRDWEDAGGLFCRQCRQEAVRIFNGLCLGCHYEGIARREQQQEDRTERRYYRKRLSEGTISLAQLKEGRL